MGAISCQEGGLAGAAVAEQHAAKSRTSRLGHGQSGAGPTPLSGPAAITCYSPLCERQFKEGAPNTRQLGGRSNLHGVGLAWRAPPGDMHARHRRAPALRRACAPWPPCQHTFWGTCQHFDPLSL